MRSTKLDWGNFDWKYFEDLCREIAETEFPDIEFDIHLSQGYIQDGIDITGFDSKKGKFICIQSKRNNKFGLALLKDAIKEFVEGNYSNKTYYFIIATSKDLQDRKSKIAIDNHKVSILKNNDIIFNCWDQRFIEKKLLSRFGLVSKYFGKYQATRFCNPEIRFDAFLPISPVTPYINRQLYQFDHISTQDHLHWHFNKRERFDLFDIITKTSVSKKLFIIGDPYEGKSSYLKSIALNINSHNGGSSYQSIFIELKNFNSQPVESILNSQCGDWESIPLLKIILFIDGLDEIETDKLENFATDLKIFCSHHKELTVICSCRKIFYVSYEIDKILNDFLVFELAPITEDKINEYLKKFLKDAYNNFRNSSGYSNVFSFLHHPFYLTQIVQDYLTEGNLPKTKISVIDSLVNKSIENSKARKLKGGTKVRDVIIDFKELAEKFSFALQLSGLNTFKDEQMHQLFTIEERILLQNNPMITVSSSSWSFVNAMFQEHISARALSKLPFSDILKYTTIGKSIKKVKKKWVQTLSALLSFCDPNSILFKDLRELFEKDNIELLFETEPTQYSTQFRLELLKKLLQQCSKDNRRLLLIYEDKIANFVNDYVKSKDYLINFISDANIPDRAKIIACQTLELCTLSDKQKNIFLEIAVNELIKSDDAYYAGRLIQVMANHKIGDRNLIIDLVNRLPKFNAFHEYRDKLYELITTLGLVDEFPVYGIDGVLVLFDYNRKISHGGSERRLQNFFLSAKNPIFLSSILSNVNSSHWKKHFGKSSSSYNKTTFIKRLLKKLEIAFAEEPSIIITVASFIKSVGKKYLTEDYKEINDFLHNTQTHTLITRLLIKDIFEDGDWQLGSIITPKSYDYILFEFEEKNYSISALRSCLAGMSYSKENREESQKFFQLCNDALEGQITITQEDNKYDLYLKREQQKKDNDLKVIQSHKSFIKGVRDYFKEFGTKTISLDALNEEFFIDLDQEKRFLWKTATSNFVYHFLLENIEKNKIHLSQCLKILAVKEKFEYFKARDLLRNFDTSIESVPIYKQILEDYYYYNIQIFDFVNCELKEDNQLMWEPEGILIGDIFKKLKPKTKEQHLFKLLWLDTSGINGFETSKLNKNETISQIILGEVVETATIRLKKQILENIATGIKSKSILGTHLKLCEKLKIVEALEIIYDFLQDANYQKYFGHNLIDIYLNLGGNSENLLELLENTREYETYFFSHLVHKLYKIHPLEVKEILTILFIETDLKEKKIEFVRILCELGSIEAFQYLVLIILTTNRAPYTTQSGYKINQINTDAALVEINKIKHFILEKNDNNNVQFYETAKGIALEWLFNLAEKSETDLLKVIEFLETAKIDLKSYENADDFNWYINRVLENFRDSNNGNKTITEIKAILNLKKSMSNL